MSQTMSSLEQKQLIKDVLSAAEQGHRKNIESYISRGVVNVLDEEGSTPLMYAAANGREEIIRLLLDRECIFTNKLEYNTDVKYIDQQNAYGWTALMQAACYGHLNVVISLIQRGAKVNIPNCWGATALMGACQGGYFGVVHKLLNVGAEVNPWEENEADTLTPLMAATQCGHVEIVRELVTRGANVETKLKGTKWTALMLAALNNQLSVMDILLRNGAKKKECDINNKTATDFASALGHHDIVMLLTGKKPKTCTDVEFFELVKSGDVDKVKVVLEKQKELANSQDKDGATPLMFAASRGSTKMCSVLLDAGAAGNTKDHKYGWTALMLATHQRKYDVVKYLGQRGADVNVRGKSGSTAFDIANMISDIQMIRLVANISVEQIQMKIPTEPPPLAIPVVTGGMEAIVEHVQSTLPETRPEGQRNELNEVAENKTGPVKPSFIDLTDLKRKLDKAYRTPTPSISVGKDEPASSDSPTQSRFPTARIKSYPSSSRLLATPTPSSLSSSAASEPFSLASSSSSYSDGPTVRTPVDRDPIAADMDNGIIRSSLVVTSPRSKHKPTNLYLKGGGVTKVKGPLASPKNTSQQFPIPRSASTGRKLDKGYLQPKANSGLGREFSKSPNSSASFRRKSKELNQMSPLKFDRDFGTGVRKRSNTDSPGFGREFPKSPNSSISLKLKSKESSQLSPLKFDRDFGVSPRKRSDTAPVSPYKTASSTRARKKGSITKVQPPPGMDLRSALEQESLGHFYSVLKAQEIDYASFVALRDGDLEEMGIETEHRNKLLALIAKLNTKVFIFQ